MIQYLINIIDYAEYKYLAITHKESTKILEHGRVGIFIIELPSNLLYNLSEMVISYYTFRMDISLKRCTS